MASSASNRGCDMAELTIRDLPGDLLEALHVQAARHGRCIEAEVRAILIESVTSPAQVRLGSRLAEIGRETALTDEEFDALTARERR
ncbi:FitA-like ribbon-helix-helix domain-containing protein [Nocardia beijingensis]|uniref:FitA-like ribbon-helix-helix domain-containing protein n=1 Tax=Nocardia beijingensis TaxID=95162 RepID=A0ABW7WNL1_9NOCA